LRVNFSSKKTIIIYLWLIIAIAFFAVAYFSSYSSVKLSNYASEFAVLRTEANEETTGFELVDVTDSAMVDETDEEDTLITPIGIGKVPSLSDPSNGEIKIYNLLKENDGAISEEEKAKLTENLHWQEYITAPNETLAAIARDFGVPASVIRKANNLANSVNAFSSETLLCIPDGEANIEITRRHVMQLREEAARALREKNKMHPLLYVVQKGDTASKIAKRFGLKEATLMSANPGKKVRPGVYLKIPTMNGIYVVVRKSTTVSELARNYGSNAAAIMRANGLANTKCMRGTKLFIPGGKIPEERVFVSKSFRGKAAVFVGESSANIGRFRWPCQGRFTSPFGYRRSPFRRRRRTVFHAGIDISAPRGTPVVASADGVVTHAGWMSGYGKTIVIQHGGGVSTLYGHNSSLLVGAGAVVSRGQIIARVGSTGRSTGNHCHFEIRRGGRPTNPLRGLR